ncbi:MAG TPA: aminodeoxychorismate synthase component I [Rariglobus sp.]|jgi:para-aminobenzoate synthetase component 1|nr:aminodeoxychorismate synthase component I [Rariglobus sp.]
MAVVLEEITLDTTPAALFAGGLHDRPHAFFLDSGLSAAGLGAYSFIGLEPFLVFSAKGHAITLTRDGHDTTHTGDAFAELQSLLKRYHAPAAPDCPVPFTGGAVGFFSYELCTQFEKITRTAPDDLPDVPDLTLAFYDGLIAHEHVTGRTWLVANPVHTTSATDILARLRAALAQPATPNLQSSAFCAQPSAPTANFTATAYTDAIACIKAYIASGDVYQVNLTQRFSTPLPCPPFALYERLRARSAAPFASYLNFGPVQIVSSSPERFLRIAGRRVETRPIKGTRRRDASPAADILLADELLASPKDRAELLMIVDLERNDLGRVCEYGSVRVDDLWHLESHPTVHHLVANVSGTLRPECDVIDCLRATFPGGSITGAPKIRAMQIIDELEPHRRHIYTGAIGYIGFNGDCDLNIAIRTLTCTGGRAHYSVGGGIVWDSDPAAEYQETLDKGRAMHEALTADY